MTSILPGLIDKWRNKRNGQRRYVGQVVRLADGKSVVIAEVLAEMENDPKCKQNTSDIQGRLR